MEANCAPLLSYAFLHKVASQEKSVEASLIRYIHVLLYIWCPLANNSKLSNFVDRIYPIDFEIKDTTDTARPALYFDLHLQIDDEGLLRTKLYDKRDYYICSNISAAPVHGVYISQFIWYYGAFGFTW